MNVLIEGVATTQTPFNSGTEGWKEKNGIPVTGTRQQPMRPPGEADPIHVPYLPANTLRHTIRVVIERHLRRAWLAKNQKMTPALAHTLLVGTASGRPSGANGLNAEEAAAFFAHPVLGLLGGGARMWPSAYAAYDAPIMLKECVQHLTLPGSDSDKLREAALEYRPPIPEGSKDKSERRLNMTFTVPTVRGEPIFNLSDPDAPKYIKDFGENLDRYQQLYAQSREDKDGNEVMSEATGKPKKGIRIQSYQKVSAVGAGFPFRIRFETLRDATEEQVAVLLFAVEELTRRQLGGYARFGWGRFQFDLSVTIDEKTHRLDSSEIRNWVERGKNTLDACQLAEFEAFAVDKELKNAMAKLEKQQAKQK